MRGPQCRIQVNVKKVYVGSSDVGVYLLHAGGELLLGRIFIRGGAGEFRTQIQSENVDGSGLRVDECYGLTIMSWKMPGRVTQLSGRMRWHRRQKFSWQR